MLQLKSIVKTYGEGQFAVNALKGIDLNFRKSEFVSVLGPSGCGKTTLLNIIGGLDKYTDGDLIINGVSTKEYKSSDWDTYRNSAIGFVFQNYNLIPHQNVLSNVELALTLSGVDKVERKRRAKIALEKVGLKGLEHKLPNQMSGGQMQRVAIARALVNDPDIILADEPTGALDSETSIQVMELLKEVAKDRLVIMVTHNPTIAKKYSTRIITLLDGKVTGDSNPFLNTDTELQKKDSGKKQVKDSKMKFATAFRLSLSNLFTKKARTILTAIAGSIGIIGIALVLSVSTGFSTYINNLQASTLSVYPVTISESTIDLTDFEKLINKNVSDEMLQQKLTEYVYTRQMFGDLSNMLKSNQLSDEYVNGYVEKFIEKENEKAKNTENGWSYCLQKNYGFDVNDYIYSEIKLGLSAGVGGKFDMPVDQLVRFLEGMFDEGISASDMNISASFIREYIPTMSEIPDNQSLISSQYELLKGKWATEEDEVILVVDKYNRISDITLALLGIKSIDGINKSNYTVTFGGGDKFSFDELLQKKFYYIKNDVRYISNGDGTYNDQTYINTTDTVYAGKSLSTGNDFLDDIDTEIKVVGIVRLKENVSQGVLDTGIAYTSKLVAKILNDNKSSAIVNDVKSRAESNRNVLVNAWGEPMVSALKTTCQETERTLAGNPQVSKLYFYSVDYDAKENLKLYLDQWNDAEGRTEETKVHYSDSTEMLFKALNSIVDAVGIVLICFTAISLVVSSIMIGIITYVSVVERTKEIGILRSIGARKKDISRIFNAETFLTGLFAGLIGITATYLLTIPINLIVGTLIENVGNIASLKITHAVVLVVVSFILTLIAGLIPSRIAAKKDPVVALRTE